jgi:hypothetical protein
VPCARTHISSSFSCAVFSLKITMQPVNHREIDMSSYFSAITLGMESVSASDRTASGIEVGLRGAPHLLLRLEGAAAFAAGIALYAHGGFSWLLFAGLILAPDVSMLAYLVGPRAGAAAYNSVHTYVLPLPLLAAGYITGAPAVTACALIWIAHIGFDRAIDRCRPEIRVGLRRHASQPHRPPLTRSKEGGEIAGHGPSSEGCLHQQ